MNTSNHALKDQFRILKKTILNRKKAVIGIIRTEERLFLDTLSYNLIRSYALTQEIKNSIEDLENFCERESV